ncbi:type II toxin-antitoxin system VapC family toxin [Acidovorax sp. DW039]|uniref:type II toxin-antitoxin system VapC family toxin n=1 Tax=Acidovorax sp. DW039 TaxID=3095606 RepID=UPI00308E7F20|nr:type II toxin-antitoxin system VapC family toxin [Acidovorax sp. DW039]
MNNVFARAEFFDASALVLLYVDDDGSEAVREYFNRRPTVYTTEFCFHEALSVLKTKWRRVKRLSREEYLTAAHQLTIWFMGMRRTLPEIALHDPDYYPLVKDLATRSGLDYSDALQLASLMYGNYSHLARESQTVLTTADRELARAARAEGLKVWSVLDEAPPSEI